jgi:AraC-like DNA-binding protein
MERRMISAGFVEDALAGVRRAGLPVAPLLARAGIPEPVGASVSAEQYGALWREIARTLDDEYFGLGARPMRAGSFAMLCQVILHAATLEEALKRALRFLRLVLDAPHGRLVVEEGLARIVLEDDGPARSAFAYRTFWVIVHGITCWLVGRRIPLRGVDFRAPSPAHGPDYGLFFGAPVRFSQPASVLAFDAAFLKLPARRDGKALAEFLRRAPANILVRYRHDAGLAARVRAHLRALPPTAWPGMREIAARLRLSELTLRRRLKAEGLTYRDIKEEVRRSLALEWLGAGGRGVGEIAADLGFSEPSAFHRAFRKWTGTSPGAYRRRG